MSHHIYHTRGILLGSTQIGESNRFYRIFTEDLGLVGASAQSVREGKSKLRYVLQDFSFVTVDLVHGKDIWRIVSAGEWRDVSLIKGDLVRIKFLARLCAIVSRLLQGEGPEIELFNDLVGFETFLEGETIPVELYQSLEALSVLRVLSRLGYIDGTDHEMFLGTSVWTVGILEEFEKVRINSIPKINEALHASHL